MSWGVPSLRYSRDLVAGLQVVANRKISLDYSTYLSQLYGTLQLQVFNPRRCQITLLMVLNSDSFFTARFIPIPFTELLQSHPERTAASSRPTQSSCRKSLTNSLSTSSAVHLSRSMQSQSPSWLSFKTTLAPYTTRSESSVMAKSASPSLHSLAIWLSDSQGATMNSIPLVCRARIAVATTLSSITMHLERYFLACSSLPFSRQSIPFCRFSSLAFLLFSMVSPFLPTNLPSKTQMGLILQQERRSSISKMKERNMSDSIFWLSSQAQRQHPLYSQLIISIAAVLHQNELMCYLMVIGYRNLSRPQMPILALIQYIKIAQNWLVFAFTSYNYKILQFLMQILRGTTSRKSALFITKTKGRVQSYKMIVRD